MDSSATPIIDRDFLEARARLLDLAAYLDRVDRAGGSTDFRHRALMDCLPLLETLESKSSRVQSILIALSDPSATPLPAATFQGAIGAPPPMPTLE